MKSNVRQYRGYILCLKIAFQKEHQNNIHSRYFVRSVWSNFRLINTLMHLGTTHEDLMPEIEFAAASHHVTIGIVAADIFSHLLPQRFDELRWQRVCRRITVTKTSRVRTNLSRIVVAVVPLKPTRWLILRFTHTICYFTFYYNNIIFHLSRL